MSRHLTICPTAVLAVLAFFCAERGYAQITVTRDTAQRTAHRVFSYDEDISYFADTLNSISFTTGSFYNCSGFAPTQGCDPIPQQLKNRDVEPRSNHKTLSIDDILYSRPDDALAAGDKSRGAWPSAAQQSVGVWENTFVTVEGFLTAVKMDVEDGCGCASSAHPAMRIWLSARSGESKELALPAEISSRIFDRHPKWHTIMNMIDQPVRVSGWLFWNGGDKQAYDNHDRATPWEIYPVMKLEFGSDAGWIDLK